MSLPRLITRLLLVVSLVAGAPLAASAQAPDSAAPMQSYVLGPEDVVEVNVLGRADFLTRARVRPDGTIQLPYLGSVPAANKTAQQLGEEVGRALKSGGYFASPIVSVDIVSYASRYVTVLGAVGNPGLVPVDRAYRLSEILARVGGVREGGADHVVLRPANGDERRLTIRDLATGDLSQDPFVSPGDKIYAPNADLFYISGQVKAPGAYPMNADMTLRMAIARAGGLTDSGSDRRVKVTREGRPVGRGLDDKIQPGDVVVVGERLF